MKTATHRIAIPAIFRVGRNNLDQAGRRIAGTGLTGHLADPPVICVPTAPANDGFSSSACPLVANGRRRSIPAKMPPTGSSWTWRP